MGAFIDLSNKRFNNLLVLKRVGTSKSGQPIWLCVCDCGKKIKAGSQKLRTSQKSCRDCFKIRQKTHGLSRLPEYHIWILAMDRCYNENNIGYQNYGGRGIKVCLRWHKVENFISDMGKRPTPSHSIERINVNGNYTPNNCRWATRKEQMRNRTDNTYLTLNGVTQSLVSWSETLGIKYATLLRRMKAKWSDIRVLTTPVKYNKYR